MHVAKRAAGQISCCRTPEEAEEEEEEDGEGRRSGWRREEGREEGEGINLLCLLPLRVHLCAAQAGGSVV